MRLVLILMSALMLASCATATRVDAAADVHAFLVSVRNADRPTFERYVDRRALNAQMEARLRAEVRESNLRPELRAVASILAGPLADTVGDALIRPSVFRAVAITLGYDPATPVPSTLAIATVIRPLPDGRVCATRGRDRPCLFDFERQDGVWRMVAFSGDLGDLRL